MQEPSLGGACRRSALVVGIRLIARWFFASCLVVAVFRCPSFSADSTSEKNVLVLDSFSVREAFVELEPLKTTVRARVSVPVNFYVEYLESERFGSAAYEKALRETIRQSYRGKQINLVVVASYPALRFAIDNRDQIFPGVPIVFISVAPDRIRGGIPWPNVTGAMTNVDVRGSVDLALRLHPDTQIVALVGGNSEFEQYWLGAVRDEVHQRHEKLRLIELPTGSARALLKQVSGLPPHTIVFFDLIPLESYQEEIGTYDVLAAIAQRFPTYCIFNYCLDHGGVGGSFMDERICGVKGGELAARVLSGEKPENLPPVQSSVAFPQVDWRQLRRWNIPESSLPPGTIVLYRQPTVWERYEKYILAGAVLIVVQALLIVGLLWQRARKRKTEFSLRESEQRFRVMANTTPSLVWMCDPGGKVIYLNDRWISFTGRNQKAGFEETWTAFIHPEDVKNVRTANSRALEQREGFSKEYRLRRRDGMYRWMLDVAAPRIDGNGSFAGFIGSAADVTEQKLAQEALERLSGKLIDAQEKERSRIARELHDDICQRLAMLSHQIAQAAEDLDREHMREVWQHCSDITGDVQALSHELHSSMLDVLGLAAALQSFCREFSEHQDVVIEFTQGDVRTFLSREVSLCLFRVVQESLRNAVKHSGAKHFEVHLRETPDHVEVEIKDEGVGFDSDRAKKNGGLGLISMQERANLVNGTVTIESKPNCGTKIRANIPLITNVRARSAEAA
jgi:PAS domain S-box-containing protein